MEKEYKIFNGHYTTVIPYFEFGLQGFGLEGFWIQGSGCRVSDLRAVEGWEELVGFLPQEQSLKAVTERFTGSSF